MKQKAFFIIFKGLSMKKISQFFGRWESKLTLNDFKSALGINFLTSSFCKSYKYMLQNS